LNFITGDIRKLGLKKLPYGPLEQIQKDQSIPLLDIGTLKLIKDGNATVYDGIDRIEGFTIHFTDGKKVDFGAIVATIDYEKGFAGNIIKVDNRRIEDLKNPISNQVHFGEDGF
jgi:indole-3-pyruvate monooxygenase